MQHLHNMHAREKLALCLPAGTGTACQGGCDGQLQIVLPCVSMVDVQTSACSTPWSSAHLMSCAAADTFIQKTKKLYVDTRTQRNINKLTEDISQVHSIMTKNIQEVLGHGERLDSELGGPARRVE